MGLFDHLIQTYEKLKVRSSSLFHGKKNAYFSAGISLETHLAIYLAELLQQRIHSQLA